MRYSSYVALGDSISIDSYPQLDHMERHDLDTAVPGLGAACLLYQNADTVWPDFGGKDLSSLYPGIQLDLRASDGATTAEILEYQLPTLEGSAEPTLVTLTAGGNDLLKSAHLGGRALEDAAGSATVNLRSILSELRGRFPCLTVLVATVYDPTDGTMLLDGVPFPAEASAQLAQYNKCVAGLCTDGHATLVDLHGQFLGHGVSAPPEQRWYWNKALIEPGWRGANEIRRLWFQAIDGHRL